MKLLCPAYKFDKPDPKRMEVYRARHEQLRLQHRLEMLGNGWHIVDAEMRIGNNVLDGKIDDVFQSRDGRIVATDYCSSLFPKMYKFIDAALSAGFLSHDLDTPASARIVSPKGIIDIPDDFKENIYSTAMSEEFRKTLSLSDDEQLEYANPASGICTYCANRECKRKTD